MRRHLLAAVSAFSLWGLGAQAAPVTVGQYAEFSATPTVTASSAYAAGNAVGGLLTFTNVGVPSPGGRIESVSLYSKSAQTAQVDFVWCAANNPTSTTITDKTAISVNAADFDKCKVVAQLTNWSSLGTVSVAYSGQLAAPFALSTGQTGYGFLVTRGTPTFTSTSDLQLKFTVGY